MTNVAALPALALIVGAAAGVYAPMPLAAFIACAMIGWLALTIALTARTSIAASRGGVGAWFAHVASIASVVGFFGAGAALAAHATREALTPPILADSHAMRVDVAGASGAVPVVLSGVIRTDATPTEFGAMFVMAADAIVIDGVERETAGTIRIAVGGTFATRHIDEWRAGRRVRVTATLAAPLPYLNIGTPNQETRLALSGIRLFGSVKSAAQVELLARGRWWDEAAASARAFVRRAVAEHVGRTATRRQDAAIEAHTVTTLDSAGGNAANGANGANGAGAAIATAILIGDRAGLDQEVEERLQRAGTFHVIAISGGNIAILTALILGLLRLCGTPPRACAWLTICAIALYALVVGSGASVARAALAAIVYLFARALDHRTPPLNVLAVVVAIMLVWAPLEIVDAGFWLTCLATLAIMLLAQRLADRASLAFRRIANFASASNDFTALQSPHSSRLPQSSPPLRDSGASSAGVVFAGLRDWHGLPSFRRIAYLASASNDVAVQSPQSSRLLQSPSPLRDLDASGAGIASGPPDWHGLPVARRLTTRVVESAIGLLAATVAAEAVLLPVTAYAFSQVSLAGLLLNFLAIPLMTVVQIAGIAIVAFAHGLAPIADFAGMIVDFAARGIVSSSRIVDAAPWSAPRVAPPPLWLLLACQASLCLAWFGRPPPWRRRIGACAWLTCLALVVSALPLPTFALHAVGSQECQMTDADPGPSVDADAPAYAEGAADRDWLRDSARARLRVTFLDVAQGDATLIRFPDGRAWLVDAGGAIGRFDIGTRIVSPALWALGLRRLSTLVVTHGDRDHIGGAHAMLRDFRPAEVWEGVPVEGHAETTRLRREAARHRLGWRIVHSGERIVLGERVGSHREAERDGLGRMARTIARDAEHALARDTRSDPHRLAHLPRGTRAGDDGLHHHSEAVDIRVWHPSAPSWTRTRVRNDDSIVLELALGNVSLILPGDIGPAVERVLATQHVAAAARSPALPSPAPPSPMPVSIKTKTSGSSGDRWMPRSSDAYATGEPIASSSAPPRVKTVKAALHAQLPSEHLPLPAVATATAAAAPVMSKLPLRVLKIPHHGSKTSSTAPFLDALQPRLAIVSAGRGNRHGHPAPAALARYAARGTEVFRTDQDGAIQLDTDGHTITVRTCSGRRLTLAADSHD